MLDKNGVLKSSKNIIKDIYFDGYRPSYYFKAKGDSHIDLDSLYYMPTFKSYEELNKSININYGDNTMSFDENGDIKINDRLLTNDEDIVNALRMLLNLK